MQAKRKSLTWLFTTPCGIEYKLHHYIKHRGDKIISHSGAAENFEEHRSEYEFDVLFNYDKGDEPLNVIGAINGSIRSVRKDIVDKYMTEAFGYSLMIDARKHFGYAVIKNTKQATHSGRIVQCPISRPDSREWLDNRAVLQRFVYQRLIDNRIFGLEDIKHQAVQYVRDLRISCMFGEIVCVYIRDKTIQNLFHPHTPSDEHASLAADVLDVMTKTESNQIIDFCRRMRIDYAELDVLRDNSSGRLYIVDVNNVPAATLFSKLSERQLRDALDMHAACIDRHIHQFTHK